MKIGPKYKICRRLGSDVFGKCQSPKYVISEAKKSKVQKGKRPKPLTDYGKQMRNKQKVRLSYHVSEKQFANYVKSAMSKKGVSSTQKLYEDLETRLDNVVYRLGLANSRALSRQMVSHGHIDVNGKRITIPSFKVGVGDKVSIRERSKNSPLFKDVTEKVTSAMIPSWVKFDLPKMEATITGKPVSVDNNLDFNSVIEFYSR